MAPAATALAAALALAAPGAGEGLAGPAEALRLRISLKATGLLERDLDLALPPSERNRAAGLTRLRLDLGARPAPGAALEAAWEQRLRVEAPAALGAGAGALPAAAPGPHRLWQLDWPLARGPGLAWRHEVDRAALVLAGEAGRLTVGRQAIGWGRGVLFGAVDLFAPFSPLEVDREWRRGVDALRAEATLGPRASAEAVVAGGERAADLAAVARLRGRAGEVDGELAGGWRAGDAFLGLAASGAAGDAEVHGELAAFRGERPLPAGGSLGDPRLAWKAVLGASTRFPVGKGLQALVELHHSGFGARRPGDLATLVRDPAFVERALRGDTQTAGRWAAAASCSYEADERTTLSATALASPRDGSGVLAPTLRFDLGDRTTVVASLFLPWGARTRGGVPRSDLGGTPVAGLIQISVYE